MTISNPCQGCPHLSYLYLPSLQWQASDSSGISNEKKYLEKITTLESKLKITEEALESISYHNTKDGYLAAKALAKMREEKIK